MSRNKCYAGVYDQCRTDIYGIKLTAGKSLIPTKNLETATTVLRTVGGVSKHLYRPTLAFISESELGCR